MDRNYRIDLLKEALEIPTDDLSELFSQLQVLSNEINIVLAQGMTPETSIGTILHPSLPSIYALSWRFTQSYNSLGLPTSAEICGLVNKTSNIVNLRRT